MSRLLAGTPWDRPPRCERCGALASDCTCPPPETPRPPTLRPDEQTAQLSVEKRPRGKRVTVVRGLDPAQNVLDELARRLKAACGSGGTSKDDVIEIQGEHRARVEAELIRLGYRVRRGS